MGHIQPLLMQPEQRQHAGRHRGTGRAAESGAAQIVRLAHRAVTTADDEAAEILVAGHLSEHPVPGRRDHYGLVGIGQREIETPLAQLAFVLGVVARSFNAQRHAGHRGIDRGNQWTVHRIQPPRVVQRMYAEHQHVYRLGGCRRGVFGTRRARPPVRAAGHGAHGEQQHPARRSGRKPVCRTSEHRSDQAVIS